MSEQQPTREDMESRIRVLEAANAVQRMGLEKAQALISEFDVGEGDNLAAVGTSITEWIDYGLSPGHYQAYENRVRTLIDLLETLSGFLHSCQDENAFLGGAENWLIAGAQGLGAKIREIVQQMPPLLRGSVCKLALGCPEHHTRDCRREIESLTGAMAQATEAAGQLITDAIRSAAGPSVRAQIDHISRTDLDFFAELMKVLRFTDQGLTPDTDRRFVKLSEELLAIAPGELAILKRYAKNYTEPPADIIQTEGKEN